MPNNTTFLVRLVWITVAALVVSVVWFALPLIEAELSRWRAEPRLVTPRGDLAADEQATIRIFENNKDSVVYITTTARMVDYWTRNAYEVPRGTGSGFVWDEFGHIVTNNHVIAGASSARVILADGRAFQAQLTGASAERDLAVLRITVRVDLPPPVTIGSSHDLQVGQKVFAIGNPFGLDWTLTTGIVSALGRELHTDTGRVIEGLIQTDAAINPGNSGGPLLDSAGRLIAVNTAIYSPSGASAGIGFAVPVDEVNRVVPQLIAKGRYLPPSLGIRSDPALNSELDRRLGVEGVFVLGVEPGSAAERAGIRPARIDRDGAFVPGDVIVAIGERKIATVADLDDALEAHKVGETVKVTLLRNGSTHEVEVRLQASG